MEQATALAHEIGVFAERFGFLGLVLVLLLLFAITLTAGGGLILWRFGLPILRQNTTAFQALQASNIALQKRVDELEKRADTAEAAAAAALRDLETERGARRKDGENFEQELQHLREAQAKRDAEHARQLSELTTRVKQLEDERLQHLAALKQKDALLAEREAVIRDRDAKIVALTARIDQQQGEIDGLKTRVDSMEHKTDTGPLPPLPEETKD